MVQAAYHRKLLKAGIKVNLHRLTLSGCGTRLSDGRTNSASSPSESVAGLPKHGPVSIHGRGPKKSGCKLSGHLDDKRAYRTSEVLLHISGKATNHAQQFRSFPHGHNRACTHPMRSSGRAKISCCVSGPYCYCCHRPNCCHGVLASFA